MTKDILQKEILRQKALREKARRDLKTFLLLKWRDYNKMPFNDSWHFDYLCRVLESTLPYNDTPITRLMINMPPSYGKTETIARTFIAWSLGRDRSRKYIYISYSDELCRKISNQVRDLIKSKFWQNVFKEKAIFLQDNSNEFVLKEGGGLFVTTLKSAITGFHAHQILIDDPIKVSEMSSRSARELVNQNFKESVLSRLQDNDSNITILMQRLGEDDLCGYLLNERYFAPSIIRQWQVVKLSAINEKKEYYQIGDYRYEREAREPLFALRHNIQELENQRLSMGEDEFSTQYLQEPLVSEAGYFELSYFSEVPLYDIGEHNEYIFCDPAMSLNASSDNRAFVVVGVEMYKDELPRYIVKDCIYGIWDEERSARELINLMLKYPKSKVYIESDGGGLILHRILQKEIVKINTELKAKGKDIISNTTLTYTPSRKISKVDKIKAMRSYYNTGYLVFLNTSLGLDRIKKELLGFNPAKPFRKDDCIDALSSAIASSEVIPPYRSSSTPKGRDRRSVSLSRTWRI